jgi:putative thioredoxin
METEMRFVQETTDATFEQDVIQRSTEVPVVVDFWAQWCQPCRLIGPMLEKLAVDFAGQFVLVKANLDQNQAVAELLRVSSIPAIYGFRDGELLDSFVGLLPEQEIKAWIERLLPTEADRRLAEADRIAATDPEGAERKYREALDLDANLTKAKIALAEVLFSLERFAECRELATELEQTGLTTPAIRRIQAELELQDIAGQAGSVEEYRAALELHPDQPELKFKLAEALAGAGQYQEALETGLWLVREHKQQFGEPARKLMVDIFQVLPEDSELTGTYRRQLAAALY